MAAHSDACKQQLVFQQDPCIACPLLAPPAPPRLTELGNSLAVAGQSAFPLALGRMAQMPCPTLCYGSSHGPLRA